MGHAHRIALKLIALAVIALQGYELSAQQESPKERRKARKEAAAQRPDPTQQHFTVKGGIITKTDAPTSLMDSLSATTDSTGLLQGQLPADSAIIRPVAIASDSLKASASDSTAISPVRSDSTLAADRHISPDLLDSLIRAEMSRRELRRLERAERKADSSLNHHYYFKDSIPISRLTAMSLVIPGLAQFYNKQEWKIPILYGTVAAGIFFGIRESKNYSFYKKQYDIMLRMMPDRPSAGGSYNPETFAKWRAAIDPIQDQMIRHNTNRQLLLGGALASYIYFIGDGAVNYPGQLTTVKKATTLSTICPGAGQIYNGSYWKVPIIMGGIATFAYVIDWNNRGYQRFKLAYDQISEANEKGIERFDEFKDYRNLSQNQIKKYKDSYRRNRDLCIILACGFYVLNIIDAHVDAHLRDYDVSDDLSFNVGPSITPFHLASTGTSTNLYGISFGFHF